MSDRDPTVARLAAWRELNAMHPITLEERERLAARYPCRYGWLLAPWVGEASEGERT